MLRLLAILPLISCTGVHSHKQTFLTERSKFQHGDKLIRHINSIPGNTWTAGHNFDRETTIQHFIDSRMGLISLNEGNSALSQHDSGIEPSLSAEENSNDDDIPETYDAREKYPHCVNLRAIKDQSNCGSCWAVSIAATLSDRFCIHSEGKIAVNLSANYFMACSEENEGCKGGYMDEAWKYIRDNGLISGGDFESDEGCQPYVIKPCGFDDTLPCPVPSTLTPKCKHEKCNNEYYSLSNEKNKFKVSTYYRVNRTEKMIRAEIYENGPVTAGFMVYEDFPFYKSGVYVRQTYRRLGGHAVRVIGWGVENTIRYWLVTNSWSSRWGDNGIFKILRGYNECGFESEVYAGLPVIN